MSGQSETSSNTSLKPPISAVTNSQPKPTATKVEKPKPWHASFPPKRRGHVVKTM